MVDEHLQTSDRDIYAVGDAIQVSHFVSGLEAVIPLAGPANKQGRIAADNICGRQSTYQGLSLIHISPPHWPLPDAQIKWESQIVQIRP